MADWGRARLLRRPFDVCPPHAPDTRTLSCRMEQRPGQWDRRQPPSGEQRAADDDGLGAGFRRAHPHPPASERRRRRARTPRHRRRRTSARSGPASVPSRSIAGTSARARDDRARDSAKDIPAYSSSRKRAPHRRGRRARARAPRRARPRCRIGPRCRADDDTVGAGGEEGVRVVEAADTARGLEQRRRGGIGHGGDQCRRETAPERAPSRSTRWMRAAPASTQRRASVAGSSARATTSS